jgi:glycosyltransferase involved in cell wall biosynthesis
MKILHIYKDYSPVLGGIENHVRALAEGQAARGHDVTVLVNATGARTTVSRENGVRVVRAGRLVTVGGSVPLSPAFPFLLGRERPDIAHLQFPYPPGEVANLFFGRARHTVISYQSDVVRQRNMLSVYRPLMERVLRRADRIIASSANYVRTSPFLAPLAERCTVVPLGIDVRRFATADPAAVAHLRARWGVGSEPVLLFVGRLRYYKGLDTLLRALALMGDAPGRAVIAGDGPLYAEWQALAESLGVAWRVVFDRDLPDEQLVAAYHAAQVYVLPANSRAEAYGLALVEAMAAGLPCVTTEVGTGTSWVVQDGSTGLVVPPLDPPALAGALRALLSDPRRRQALGAAGHARAVQEFDEQVMVERVLAVYKSLPN